MDIQGWGPFKINKEKFILEQEITSDLSPEDLVKEIDLSNLFDLEEISVEDDGKEWICLFFSTPKRPMIVYAKVSKAEKATLKSIIKWNSRYDGIEASNYPVRERPLTTEEVEKIKELVFNEEFDKNLTASLGVAFLMMIALNILMSPVMEEMIEKRVWMFVGVNLLFFLLVVTVLSKVARLIAKRSVEQRFMVFGRIRQEEEYTG